MKCINCIYSHTFENNGKLDLFCEYLEALDIDGWKEHTCWWAEREPSLKRLQGIKTLYQKRILEKGDKKMKTLKDLGFTLEHGTDEQEFYSRIYAHCTNILSFDKRVKMWAISFKDIETRKWQIIGISLEETEAILNHAKEFFNDYKGGEQ